ncbi:MAG: ABC transporter permease, partial [Vicinamibacterales bacterium]
QYVSGTFFTGLGLVPEAGRLLAADDDRAGAAPVAVLSAGYAKRRFGAAANAVGRQILINNLPFTVAGVTPAGFDGVEPGLTRSVYVPLQTNRLFDPEADGKFASPNYYWAEIMGRLRPGVTLAQAQSALATPFAQWVATTANNDAERANLPVLQVADGGGGLDTLRRRYAKPLYLLQAIVALILAIACANIANLLLARATARQREIAVRLSIGAGRFRLIRQLLTESLVLSAIGGALGIAIAIGGTRLLSTLLANGDETLTLQAGVNWAVLIVTVGLSLICGLLFGLVPAVQSTRLALMPALKDAGAGVFTRHRLPRLKLQQVLVVAQISLLLLLLVGAGLFTRTLANLQAIPLGFNPDHVLLFDLNAPQAGYPAASAASLYDDLRDRFAQLPGVRAATLGHSSLLKAGRAYPVMIDGTPIDGYRLMLSGPGFLSTMQIPLLAGRDIDERDRAGAPGAAVVSELFARTHFPNQDPIGRHVKIEGRAGAFCCGNALDLEIVGVAAAAQYGPLKRDVPAVLYVPHAQLPPAVIGQVTYAIRTDGAPLRHAPAIRQIVRNADSRIPVTNFKTQTGEIASTINQEILLARLCVAFAMLALVIACAGLYGTTAYT